MHSLSGRFAFYLAVLLLYTFPLSAQQHSDYHIYGRVYDVKGKGIPGVKIFLKDIDSGKGVTIKTKDDGTFDQQFIAHAVYTVSFDKEGYISKKIDKLDLSATGEQTIQKKIEIQLATPEEMKEYELQKQQAEMEKKIADTYTKGVQQFQAKQYDEAIASMQEVLKNNTNVWGAYHVIGSSYYAKQDCTNAIPNFEKSIELKQDNQDAYGLMGDCYVQKKDLPSAITAYEKNLQYDPNNLELYCVLGDLYRATEKDSDAETWLQKGMDLGKAADGTADPRVALCYKVNGEMLFKKGNMKDSITQLKKYLELKPDAPDKAQVTEMITALEQAK